MIIDSLCPKRLLHKIPHRREVSVLMHHVDILKDTATWQMVPWVCAWSEHLWMCFASVGHSVKYGDSICF